MTYSSISNELWNLSDAELRSLNSEVISILKRRRASANARVAASGTFKVNDKVWFDGKYGRTYGTITKVKRVKALVDTGEYRQWNVPLRMLNKDS